MTSQAFFGRLRVTDGTPENTVTFLAASNGVIISDWKPVTHQAKDGGVWSSSQFTDGRQLVMRSWANAIETFEVDVSGADMDGTLTPFHKLLGLLVLAGAYWMSDFQIGTGAAVKPIWIEALGECESNIRYAYIYDGSIPYLNNPHETPFSGSPSVLDKINVFIEHGVWRDQPPGDTACMKTYSYVLDDGYVGNNFYPASESDTVDANLDTSVLTTNSLHSLTDEFVPGKNLGVRFENITIPNGATIHSAYIKFISNYNTVPGETSPNSSAVFGELTANAPTYSTYANYTARALTVASGWVLDWSQPTVVGQEIYSGDLAAVIQEIVNLPGWASGNAMAFQIDSPAVGFPYNRQFAPYNDPTYDMPMLNIVYDVDDAVYGVNIPLCLNNFAAGYHVNARIDYVAHYNASTAVYSGNLIGTLPGELFPNPLGVGDRLFIGSDYPFANIDFNLLSAGDGTVTYVYKYSTAGGIAAGSLSNVVEYQFGLFDGVVNTGFMASILSRPTDWAKNSVAFLLPSKYWIVIEITNIAVAPAVIPAQTTKAIYTTAWPFWEVAEDEVSGDIPALLKFLLVQIQTLNGAGGDLGVCNHVLFGTRHYDRGANYTPYLNVQANQAGIAFFAGVGATTPDNSLAPSGKSLNYVAAGAVAETTIGKWILTTSSLVREYYGRYRAFVRLHITSGATGVLGFRVVFLEGSLNVIQQTDVRYNTLITPPGYDLIDLGFITLGASGGLAYSNIAIYLKMLTTAAATFDVLDLILFPVDENNLEYQTNDPNGYFDYIDGASHPGYQPLHDSTKPKERAHSGVVDNADDLIYTMRTKSLGQFTIPNKKRMRIYFLPWDGRDGGLKGTESLFDAWFRRVQQYLNMRGNE